MTLRNSQAIASIREARIAKKLTQQDLAQSAGCSIAYVRMLEGGYAPGDPDSSPVFSKILATLRDAADQQVDGKRAS